MSMTVDRELPITTDATPTRRRSQGGGRPARREDRLTSPWASWPAIILAILWTIPTLGLFISSFRPEADVKTQRLVDLLHQPDASPLENYQEVLHGGDTKLATYFVNSFVITIPAVIIPITLATLAAYAFAWMKFPGRDILFVAVFAMQIVPIQVTMIPLLQALRGPVRPAELPRSGPSGSRTRSSRCRWRSTCCTTS